MLLFQLLLFALFRLCLTYTDDGACLWQSVSKLGIPDADLWYGVITKAEQERSIEDLFDSLAADSSSLLNLVSELHIASKFYVEDGQLNWFELNKKRYTDPDDSFYLKTSDLEEQQRIPDHNILFPDDFPIGTNAEAPLVVLYGDLESEEFENFNLNLYREAMQGKIRLVWRSTTDDAKLKDSAISELYPYEVSVKVGSWGEEVTGHFDVPAEYISKRYRLGNVDIKDLQQLDLKVAALLVENFRKHGDVGKTLKYARQLINNLPILADKLNNAKVSVEQTEDALRKFLDFGINYDAIGVYVNGQHWRLSSLNPWSFLWAVLSERENFSKLTEVLMKKYPSLGLSGCKSILQQYSKLGVLNMQTLQPVRYDFHRIPGFSDSIIYFNDIEKDEQYSNLTKDFDAFYRDTQFGELPEYRENWNEVVFVIDFDNIGSRESREITAGLNRAIDVVAMGYPQRIGLLPLYRGKPNDLVKKIYKLKKDGIDKLKKFLSDLGPESVVKTVLFDNIPPVRDILEKFKISANSVIVNGQIYPFKNNNWNYLLSNTIKNDVGFLKNTIRRTNFTNARDLLHSRSFTIRNLDYIPDFFEDSSFTTVNSDSLNDLKMRTMYFDNNSGHVLLHTLTLVDDFSSKPALERLLNLLAVQVNGVRFRLVHVGVDNNQWSQLGRLFKGNSNAKSFMLQVSKLAKKSNQVAYFDSSISRLLRNWLPSLPTEFVCNKSFILLNGRYMYMKNDGVLTSNIVEAILQRDARRTLDFIGVLSSYVPISNDRDLDSDLIEEAVSYLSYLFYAGTRIFNNGVEYTSESTLPRLNILGFFDSDMKSSSIIADKENSLVDITIVMDPLEERTQKFLHLASLVKDLSFVQINMVMLPTKNLTFFPIHRIYSDTEVSVDPEDLFSISRDLPFNLFHTYNGTSVIVEAHVYRESLPITKNNVESQESGVCLELLDPENNSIAVGTSMKTFGYTQFALPSFQHNLTVRSCDDKYEVTSFSYNAKSDYVPTPAFHVTDLSQRKLYVKVKQVEPASKIQVEQALQDNTIHVFVTIKNLYDQESFKEKIVSIYTNTSTDISLHFWLSQNEGFEHSLTNLLSYIEHETNGRISFSSVSYQWPTWLRPQRFYERRLDASRILFLDVLPSLSKVHKLVMLSLDEPNTPDLHAMYSTSSKTCFTMRMHTDDGYWNRGYWEKYLKENRLKFYDASSSFIVNMDCYREKEAGHALRVHYQHSSADINALADIGQDLLNSVQKFIKIRPLRGITTIPDVTLGDIDKLDALASDYAASLHHSTYGTDNGSYNEHNYLHDEL